MRTLALLVCPLLLSGCIAIAAAHHLATQNEARIAFDVTEGNPKALLVKLSTIDLTRQQLIESGKTPMIVLTFRGEASYYTQTDLEKVKPEDREDAKKIQAKLREIRAAPGIESMEQCNIPLASRKLRPADLMSEVKLVPNGWIALVGYQKKGYAYIAP